MKRSIPLLIGLSLLLTSACSDEQFAGNIKRANTQFSSASYPIINGQKVTGSQYPETVALFYELYGSKSVFCTGTLIASNYVLTAAHCISYCNDGDPTNIEDYRPYMKVGIGNSESSLSYTYEIDKFISHSDFVCTTRLIKNDIALIKLKKHVPSNVATPILPLPPELAVTASEIDESDITVTHVGFGKTNAYNDYSSGTKYKANDTLVAVCPLSGKRSSYCSSAALTNGFVYFHYDIDEVSTCQGDSGGPSFIKRNGVNYVLGVTSWGEEYCKGWSATTNVSDYYDAFIKPNVGDIAHSEICNNEKDDNGDGKIDCDDEQCKDHSFCAKEICDNEIDDNGNGLIDCNDPQCFSAPICTIEICDNKIDDNGDTLIDCADPQCSSSLACQSEDCSNKVDDNGDTLVDCDDPLCASKTICQQELCDDYVDNNGDTLVDCADPQCAESTYCLSRICGGNDDAIDCSDARCASEPVCQKEICDDGNDNNGDGKIDCDDPKCNGSAACKSSGGCAMTPHPSQNHALPCLFAFAALLGCAFRRRARR